MALASVTVQEQGVLGDKRYVIGEFTLPAAYTSGGESGLSEGALGLAQINYMSLQAPIILTWNKTSENVVLYTEAGAEVADTTAIPAAVRGPHYFYALGN